MKQPPKSRKRWATVALTACIVSALVAAACNTNDSQSDSSGITDIVIATDSPASQDDNESASDSRRGGILIIDSNDCGIFDPAIDLASDNLLPNLRLASEIHAGLTRIGDGPEFTAEPELAARFNSRSGGTEWEFTLQPNLKFSDGSPLTSADVKWSWERALRKATPRSRAHTILGNIAGADQVANGTTNDIEGISLIDDQRLNVSLNSPDADWATRIADPIASILNRENTLQWNNLWVNHETDPMTSLSHARGIPETLPVGAGPFRLTAYETPARIAEGYSGDATCVIQRNGHYWQTNLPNLDAVIINARPDYLAPDTDAQDRQLTALAGGSLDFAVLDANTDPSNAPDGSKAQITPLSTWARFLVFNPDVAPFNDKNVRQALVQSVDMTRDANRFEATPAYGLIPPELLPGAAQVTLLQHDPTAAKQAWETSQFARANPYPAIERQLDIPNFTDLTLKSVLDAWTDILGINVSDIATQSEEEAQHATIKDIRYTYALPSPIAALRAAIQAFGTGDNAPQEFAQLQATLDAAEAEPDSIKRTASLENIQQQLIDEAYVLPLLLLKTGRF